MNVTSHLSPHICNRIFQNTRSSLYSYMTYPLVCRPHWCRITSRFTGLQSSLGVSLWPLDTGRPVGFTSRLAIIQSNSVNRNTTGPWKGIKASMLGVGRLLVQISAVRMRSRLARLLEKRWFIGVRATNTTFS